METSVSIREGRAEDVDMLEEISRQSFAKSWSRDGFLEELLSQNRTVWVATREALVVGYLIARPVLDVLEVLSLAVDPLERRCGTGSKLIKKGIESEGEWSVVQLEVREDNLDALMFYQSMGFEKVGRRHRYYSSRTDALLLSLVLRSGVLDGSNSDEYA